MPDIVCFGELLIRLTAKGTNPLFTLPELVPYVGGAEANVAMGLQRLGHETAMVSVIPDNDLGLAALQNVRKWGVDTKGVVTGPGRMGLYFLTTGAIHRPSDILYDRAESAFARSDFSHVDWERTLSGAGWLHISGVTAALGPNAVAAATHAMQTARRIGIKVSYDCNFRPKLWDAWGGDAAGSIRVLMDAADLIFGNYRDIELVFGRVFAGDASSDDRQRAAADHAFAELPHLKHLVSTRREQISADHNRLTGLMFTQYQSLTTQTYDVARIIDRIGGGDAFAAGVLHGLLRGEDDQRVLDYGIACGCLKHAQPGDYSLVTHEELEMFLSGGHYDVRR